MDIDDQSYRLIDNKDLVAQHADSWVKVFNMLGFAGKKKGGIYREFDKLYSRQGWIPAHFFDGCVVSRLEGYYKYEEAYYQFLKSNPEVRTWITQIASDVYDVDPSNVNSGLDYKVQECDATHLQDIAIRRALTRLKLEDQGLSYMVCNLPKVDIFEGDHLVQIRRHESEGFRLNPGQVPFHRPGLGLATEPNLRTEVWWQRDSVEDIYQRNKVLLIDPRRFLVYIVMLGPDCVYVTEREKYYEVSLPDLLSVRFRRKGEIFIPYHRQTSDGLCLVRYGRKSNPRPFSEQLALCSAYLTQRPNLTGRRSIEYNKLLMLVQAN